MTQEELIEYTEYQKSDREEQEFIAELLRQRYEDF